VRRPARAVAAVAVFVCLVAGSAQPRPSAVSLAAIETETTGPDLNGEASTDTEHPAAELSGTGNPLWAIPISKLSSTRDRPLFSASRRPRTPAAPAAPAQAPTMAAPTPAPETPPFTLVGTIVGGNSRIAIFFDDSLKTATGVKEGESDSGWTLRSVDTRSATLDGSGRTVTLDLPEPAGQESQAAPVSAPAWRNGRRVPPTR
jgi:hypothetical protein